MIDRVAARENLYNNAAIIAKSRVLTLGKYYYYLGFSLLYRLCGASADALLVNGT